MDINVNIYLALPFVILWSNFFFCSSDDLFQLGNISN